LWLCIIRDKLSREGFDR